MSQRSNRMGRWLMPLLIAGLLLAALVYALKPSPVLVDLTVARRAPMRVTIDEDGVTRIRERYVVSTPLTGRMLRIGLDVGDDVEADTTVLVRMEPTDPALLDPRQIAQARARVRAAERKLDSAKSDLAKAKVEVNFAEAEMGRMRLLEANEAASDVEFAQKELAFHQRTEAARSAGFSVDIAEYELQLEQAALTLTDPDAAAEADMELKIRAPIRGRVLRIYQESTAIVDAGSPLMEVGDPSDLEIVADVLSRDAVRVRPGATVELAHWGGEESLSGVVRLVEPSGFTKLSALGVEEQRVNVIIDLIDPPQRRPTLGDNFRVDCKITVWAEDEVLQIPTSSLFRVGGHWSTFRVDADIARETQVAIGRNNGQWAQVLDGIEDSAQVIVHPGDAVRDGVTVAPR